VLTMLSTTTVSTEPNVSPAPVELHYVKKVYINSGEATTSLCGEPMLATNNTKGMGNGTSYTCPDCMLRYSMLSGDDNA